MKFLYTYTITLVKNERRNKIKKLPICWLEKKIGIFKIPIFLDRVLVSCFLSLFFIISLTFNGTAQDDIQDTILLEDVIVIPSPFSSTIYNDHAFGNLHWSAENQQLEEASFLNQALTNAPSVHVNDGTTNPMGQDVQIRGFKASPLYGLSQEIAVYADGVRKNDLLGDVVFWDLMPTFAMRQTQIFVGSQPLFGLNSLGGTINYSSKSGFSNPGPGIRVSYGSFNRLNAIAEYGSSKGNFGYYVGTNFWQEDGWRAYSESQLSNTFGKLSYRKEKNELDLSFQYGQTALLGNGAFPIELLEREEWRNQVYTHPDRSENRLFEINANWKHQLNSSLKGQLIVAYKNIATDLLNGDESPFSEYEENGTTFLILEEEDDDEEEEEEEIEEDNFAIDEVGDRILATEENSDAILNHNQVRQESVSAAYSIHTSWESDNIFWKLLSSLSFRGGQARYIANSELGFFDETRAAISNHQTVANFNTDLITSVNNLQATTGINAVIRRNLALQLSLAFNHSNLVLDDQLGTALNGEHTFSNISGGLSAYYLLNKHWMLQSTVNSTTRNPTAVEVSCADPEAPCRLPNAFLSDPPLETVRATTGQLGLSYQNSQVNWTSTTFLTAVANDIYFVSAGPLRGSGYFSNIGQTKRWGWENVFTIQPIEQLNIYLAYTYLKATFQDEFKLPSPNHPFAEEDETIVQSGDQLALIPNHVFKGKVSYRFHPSFGLTWKQLYNSKQFVRGDESNQLTPISGYWRHDASLTYYFKNQCQIWGKVRNLTNAQYQTFGLLGEADEAGELLGEDLENNIFAGPAAPRYFELGVGLKFGK